MVTLVYPYICAERGDVKTERGVETERGGVEREGGEVWRGREGGGVEWEGGRGGVQEQQVNNTLCETKREER